ncbi:MAG TPA: hypothetical protein VF213_08425 [Dongiaceae bacterium]
MANQGPIGEAGATARTLVTALGANPYVLASVLMNLGLIGLLYWGSTLAERERSEERRLLYENRSETAKLLSRCNIQPLDGWVTPPRP